MSQGELKSLSQEELRKRLYQTFKKKGVLDSLKTQLRNQLIQDLKLRVGSGQSLQSPLVSGDSLLHRACNSLVADHLSRCGYEFSLSVFYPECGLEKDKDFSIQDLMQLLKINPKSSIYKSLMSTHQNSSRKGFLVQILAELIDNHLNRDGRDANTQTAATSPYRESIVEKLKFIDERFEEMYPKRSKFESLEGKLAEYRREMEEQLQQEMSQKFKHFKDVELAKIKLEESEKSQKEISDLRRELEKTYQLKYDGLVSREKNAVERLQRQQEIESKDVYAQRQTLLIEIEAVRKREMNLRQRIDAFELAQKLQEEKNRSVNELLRKRELDVKNIEDTYEKKIKDEVLRGGLHSGRVPTELRGTFPFSLRVRAGRSHKFSPRLRPCLGRIPGSPPTACILLAARPPIQALLIPDEISAAIFLLLHLSVISFSVRGCRRRFCIPDEGLRTSREFKELQDKLVMSLKLTSSRSEKVLHSFNSKFMGRPSSSAALCFSALLLYCLGAGKQSGDVTALLSGSQTVQEECRAQRWRTDSGRMVTRVNIGLLSAALRLVTRCLPWLPVKTSLDRCHTHRSSDVSRSPATK
ncbi:unnamed protein product, partial [Ranitomeya imitator]